MTAKYMVTMNYNGTNKQYFFDTRKAARDFMHRQIEKGCNPRHLTILHLG